MKNVLVLEKAGGIWSGFLKSFLSDVPAEVRSCDKTSQASAAFDKFLPHLLFAASGFLSQTLLQKIKVRKQTEPLFRVYQIGDPAAGKKGACFDGTFPEAPLAADFAKRFADMLPTPETLRLLVVDDEEEVGTMVRDYFEGRRSPSFKITCAANGREALRAISLERPDVIILDIKMPVMDGREFYAKLKSEKLQIPVIVFFDSISGEELSEMRRFGNPAVIEKGYKGSSLFEMMHLIKKLIYFSI